MHPLMFLLVSYHKTFSLAGRNDWVAGVVHENYLSLSLTTYTAALIRVGNSPSPTNGLSKKFLA